jgi:hypothetical protein
MTPALIYHTMYTEQQLSWLNLLVKIDTNLSGQIRNINNL